MIKAHMHDVKLCLMLYDVCSEGQSSALCNCTINRMTCDIFKISLWSGKNLSILNNVLKGLNFSILVYMISDYIFYVLFIIITLKNQEKKTTKFKIVQEKKLCFM